MAFPVFSPVISQRTLLGLYSRAADQWSRRTEVARHPTASFCNLFIWSLRGDSV